MSRKSLETTVLALGLTIIGAALFLMYFTKTSSQTMVWTNITFAVGFLVYILYSIMSTNNLNREIRGLNNHIKGLKEELEEKKKALSKAEGDLKAARKEMGELQDQLETQQKENKKLQQELEAATETARQSKS